MRITLNRYAISVAGLIVGIAAIACTSSSTPVVPSSPAEPASASRPAATTSPTPNAAIAPNTTTPAASSETPAPVPTTEPTVDPAQTSAPQGQQGAPENASEEPGFTWEIEDVDSGTKPALALTSDGVPNIAYMLEDQSGFVKNATRSNGTWKVSDVAKGYFYGPLDIAIGGDDVPRIVYHDHQDSRFMPEKGDAVVAVLNGDTWDIQPISDPGHDGWDARLIVDDDGNVHISAIDPMEFGGSGVEYYRQDGSQWKVEQVGSGELTYKYATSVAVGPDGTAYITYFDQRDNDLILATRQDSGWERSVVDSNGDTGLFSQLVIDDDGRFHISYFQRESPTSGLVKYATRGPNDSDWGISEIDQLDNLMFGFVGARNVTSVAVDSEGNPLVAYSDEKNLKLAVRTGSDWQISEVVDAESATLGQLVSLKVDANGAPHIAYFEVTSKQPLAGRIKYAKGTLN